MQCTVCKGTKVIQLTVHDYSKMFVKGDAPEVSEIKCVQCDGTGEMDQDQLDQLEWERAQWCRCTVHFGSTFHDDNTRDICSKHHYTCNCCGLITQVG